MNDASRNTPYVAAKAALQRWCDGEKTPLVEIVDDHMQAIMEALDELSRQLSETGDIPADGLDQHVAKYGDLYDKASWPTGSNDKNYELSARLMAYVDTFGSDTEGLTLVPDTWNAMRSVMEQAAAALASSAIGLRPLLEELLRHCDVDPEGETDFERAVIAARKALADSGSQPR